MLLVWHVIALTPRCPVTLMLVLACAYDTHCLAFLPTSISTHTSTALRCLTKFVNKPTYDNYIAIAEHMHTPEPALKSWYDSELYVRLLHMEREEQRKQAAAQERIQQLQQQHEETDDQQQTQQEEQSMDMPPLSDAEPAHQQQQEEHEGQQQQGGQERVQW